MVHIRTFPGAAIYDYALEKGLITDKLSYLKQQCLPGFHLTSLSNQEYIKTLLLVNVASAAMGYFPGEVKDCSQTHTHELFGQLCDVVIKCPHCLEEQTYRNMKLLGNNMISCQECYRRFYIPRLDNWHDTPINYLLSKYYVYKPEHAQEFHDRLAKWEWPADENGISGCKLELFGHTFLVPSRLEMEEVILGNFNSYYVASSEGRTFCLPLSSAAGDYRALQHPIYLKPRVDSLVSEWIPQRKRVILFGPPGQVNVLLSHTGIGEANIIGTSSAFGEGSEKVALEIPYINPKIMHISSPDVILITDVHNQDELAKALAPLQKRNIEIVKLYA
jgi:hypothetical protein